MNSLSVKQNPASLTLIRHGESLYNALKEVREQWPEYFAFTEQFNKESFIEGHEPRDDLKLNIYANIWPSADLRSKALDYFKKVHEYFGNVSDPNTPLSEVGHWQAEETGKNYPIEVPANTVSYCSPYVRTQQTRTDIFKHLPGVQSNNDPYLHEAIREQEHGLSATWGDWRLAFVRDPDQFAHSLTQGKYYYRYDGGESVSDVRNRASRFLGRIARKHNEENVLVVTHHLTILSIIAEVRHLTDEQFIALDETNKPKNCSVTTFKKDEAGNLTLDMERDYNQVFYNQHR